MTARTYGEVPGVPQGSWFENRAALALAGVHRPLVAGISGGATAPAESIVLSGGYEDDWDSGDTIIYTGHGGNDRATGQQVANQTLSGGNLGLAKNRLYGVPVRVIRGARHPSPFAPAHGYEYAGLYRVADVWHETGKSGFRIWRFLLTKWESATPPARVREDGDAYATDEPTPRQTVQVMRLIRNTEAAQAVKEMHRFCCQVCGQALETPGGLYAEAAHVRPLGTPHNGPDTAANLLCLCPNHHALFDFGAWTLNDDLTLRGGDHDGAHLRTVRGHVLDADCLRYHRERVALVSGRE